MALPHENLVAFQRADNLFIEVHHLTYERFPRSERYELGSQMRRAAFSVAANIVEGVAREHPGDTIKFLNISVSSLRELGYGLHAATRLGYLDPAALAAFEQKTSYIAAPLFGLIRRERRKRVALKALPVLFAIFALSHWST
jgi:four helix bundle protein